MQLPTVVLETENERW